MGCRPIRVLPFEGRKIQFTNPQRTCTYSQNSNQAGGAALQTGMTPSSVQTQPATVVVGNRPRWLSAHHGRTGFSYEFCMMSSWTNRPKFSDPDRKHALPFRLFARSSVRFDALVKWKCARGVSTLDAGYDAKTICEILDIGPTSINGVAVLLLRPRGCRFSG